MIRAVLLTLGGLALVFFCWSVPEPKATDHQQVKPISFQEYSISATTLDYGSR